jgi:hypothetical protein
LWETFLHNSPQHQTCPVFTTVSICSAWQNDCGERFFKRYSPDAVGQGEKFGLKLVLHAVATEQRAEAQAGFVQGTHVQPPWTTMLMAAKRRFQLPNNFSC